MIYIRIFEALKLSAKSLVYNKTRTFLSVLGVIIGTCAIISSVGLVQTVGTNVSKQLEESGLDSLILVLPSIYSIDKDELLRVLNEKQSKVVGITPKKTFNTEVLSDNGQKYKCEVLLLKPNSYLIENIELVRGRFLTNFDEEKFNRVAIVFENQVDKLFKTEKGILFRKLFIGGEEFEVIGTVKKQTKMVDMSTGSSVYDIKIIVPYNVGESLFKLNNASQMLYIKSKNSIYNTEIKKLLEQFLAQKDIKKEDYGILDGREILQSFTTTSYLLSALLGGVAAVSLIVSGIGIMNIILVSVTERTKEIGIRKAVGAKNSDIRMQFLFESFLISTLGCAVGNLLGLLIVFGLISNALKVSAYISPIWIFISMMICYIIGLIAGWAPAERASRLEPIVALRYE